MASFLDFLQTPEGRGLLSQLGDGKFYDPMSGASMPQPSPQFPDAPDVPPSRTMTGTAGIGQDPFNFLLSGMRPTNAMPPQPPPQFPPEPPRGGMPVSLTPPSPGPEARPVAPPQTQPQQSGGGLGDRLSMALSGFINPSAPGTYEALKRAGIPEAQARLIAVNPEAANSILPTLTETGTDTFTGQKQFAWINRLNQSATPVKGLGQSQNQETLSVPPSVSQTSGGLRTSPISQKIVIPPEVLQTVPTQIQGTVQSMLEGKMTPPSAAALRNPQIIALMEHANRASIAMGNGPFDATVWTQRNQAAKDEANSNSLFNKTRVSAEQIINHATQMYDLIDKLPNVDWGGTWVNAATQGYKSLTGDKAFLETRGDINQKKQALATELEKLMRGTGGSSKEIQERLQMIDIAKSPTELRAAVTSILDLMHSRWEPAFDQHVKAFGQTDLQPEDYFSPKTRESMARMQARQSGIEPSGKPLAASPQQAPAGVIKWEKGPNGVPRPVIQQ